MFGNNDFFRLAALILGLAAGTSLFAQSGTAVDLTRQRWNGNGICYSGFREGQNPDKGIYPARRQVAEDLRILARNWSLIRTYDSGQHSEDVLAIIRRDRLPLRVQLGVWLSGKPEAQAANEQQTVNAIRLANQYKDIVAAVSVGNEALVSWSDHRMTEEQLLPYLARIKDGVPQPVTIDDDYLYWQQASPKVVNLVDFISLHSYPMWGKKDIDEGLSGTLKAIESVRAAQPNKTIVLGELGWATYTDNAQNAPRAGDESKQQRYYEEIVAWAKAHRMTIFFFEAFDEPWKGSGTEGHWGLYTVDRKAKPAMRALYPDLRPSAPTSPSYDAATAGRKAQ
jgi:exo-beta-1,3-glucanase (GH17 family)